MQRRTFSGLTLAALCSVLSAPKAFASTVFPGSGSSGENPRFIALNESKPDKAATAAAVIPLLLPDKNGGTPLMQALAQRRATRDLRGPENGGAEIPDSTLSSLLWATWGVNRTDGKRTAPTANNNQAVNVYVALKTGIWLYNAPKNQLEKQRDGDVRGALGKAPLVLIYAAKNNDFGAMSVGSLYQNAGLYCASAGLGNVVRASNTGAVDKLLSIPADYKIWVTQAIGWPA
jgi:hypothetical protein